MILTRRIAYGVIVLAITGVVGLFMFNTQQDRQAMKRLAEINGRAEIVTQSVRVDDEGVTQYTRCEGGWCVTDRVPVRSPLAQQSKGTIPTVDIAALEDMIKRSKQ